MDSITIDLDLDSVSEYARFLKIKALPRFKFTGRTATIPAEYASLLGIKADGHTKIEYVPSPFLFDYQGDIARVAIAKEKFAAFVAPGYGKTLIAAEFARHALPSLENGKCGLWISPLMVIKQTVSEFKKFYNGWHPEVVATKDLPQWLKNGGKFAITNWEALDEGLDGSRIGMLIGDETSLVKSHYGAYGMRFIQLGKGVRWKLCLTGTPAPNDRIEYANHALFLDKYPTVNAFLAKFFVNKGMTGERWELKAHAIEAFYRELSDWCIFMSDPSVYGWKDNTDTIPPIVIDVLDVPLTDTQLTEVQKETNSLFGEVGGIGSRSKLARIAKGYTNESRIETNKPAFIKALVDQWPDESTIIWCKFNDEQDGLAEVFPGCASIQGSTPHEEREELIEKFKAGEIKVLISKPKVLGFGLNLQVCTRMIFSSCHDSYEEWFQAVKRANRVGSTKALHVYIPITDVERPMADNVLRKAKMIESDTKLQEKMFRQQGHVFGNQERLS